MPGPDAIAAEAKKAEIKVDKETGEVIQDVKGPKATKKAKAAKAD